MAIGRLHAGARIRSSEHTGGGREEVGLNEPIESYGFIGNMISGVLVGQGGSIDWRCLPRFASDAGLAALLGAADHGSWLIAPHGETKRTRRRYRPRSRNPPSRPRTAWSRSPASCR
jgi:GH15 family glucan-1,4-alpha-glucosidase